MLSVVVAVAVAIVSAAVSVAVVVVVVVVCLMFVVVSDCLLLLLLLLLLNAWLHMKSPTAGAAMCHSMQDGSMPACIKPRQRLGPCCLTSGDYHTLRTFERRGPYHQVPACEPELTLSRSAG